MPKMINETFINNLLIKNYAVSSGINHEIFRDNYTKKMSQVISELSYLRKTFGVTVSHDKISWKSKNIIINDLDFGRFNFYYSFKSDMTYLKSTSVNRIIKHPHSSLHVNHASKNCFTKTCLGDAI